MTGNDGRAAHELALRELLYAIAQAVHDRRAAVGWSQRELAERAGMRQPHVSRLEGAGALPKLDLLLRVADALDADLVVTLQPRTRTAGAPADSTEVAEEGVNS
ncbi:helix-turn-helix domain-containing protein [Streptomyces sp. NPDC058470]|uniref:helix-turn-helix domain-containing protein n=1 Tax=Streptomyces sp. NPDC058470 TaxID=3346515 RepID=UPI0036490F38